MVRWSNGWFKHYVLLTVQCHREQLWLLWCVFVPNYTSWFWMLPTEHPTSGISASLTGKLFCCGRIDTSEYVNVADEQNVNGFIYFDKKKKKCMTLKKKYLQSILTTWKWKPVGQKIQWKFWVDKLLKCVMDPEWSVNKIVKVLPNPWRYKSDQFCVNLITKIDVAHGKNGNTCFWLKYFFSS